MATSCTQDQARVAVRAIKNKKRWGFDAAERYAEKRGAGMMFWIANRIEDQVEKRKGGAK